MIAIQVARIVAAFVIYLEAPKDDDLKEDDAVEMMEYLGSLMDGFDEPFLRELIAAFALIATEYHGEAADLVRNIPDDFGLTDTFAPGGSA